MSDSHTNASPNPNAGWSQHTDPNNPTDPLAGTDLASGVSDVTIGEMQAAANDLQVKLGQLDQARNDLNAATDALNSGMTMLKKLMDAALPLAKAAFVANAGGQASGVEMSIRELTSLANAGADSIAAFKRLTGTP